MKKTYYFFNLEIALKQENDTNIYAYENISHVPTAKLIEIFDVNLEQDPYILDGYFLTEENYLKYAEYITKNIGKINLDVFEYCLRQYVTDDEAEIRKLYKERFME